MPENSWVGSNASLWQPKAERNAALANWKLVDDAGNVAMPGTSHARLALDGKFQSFTGFF